jgi:hypothetical protein
MLAESAQSAGTSLMACRLKRQAMERRSAQRHRTIASLVWLFGLLLFGRGLSSARSERRWRMPDLPIRLWCVGCVTLRMAHS